MNWSYLAGFFDGEGCIHVARGGISTGQRSCRGSLRCVLTQTKDIGKELLVEIQEFLGSHGIVCEVQLHSYDNPKWARSWRLNINGWDNGIRFLKLLYPYLKLKKVQAQDAIRYGKVFPYVPPKIRGMLRTESWRANRVGLGQSNHITQ